MKQFSSPTIFANVVRYFVSALLKFAIYIFFVLEEEVLLSTIFFSMRLNKQTFISQNKHTRKATVG